MGLYGLEPPSQWHEVYSLVAFPHSKQTHGIRDGGRTRKISCPSSRRLCQFAHPDEIWHRSLTSEELSGGVARLHELLECFWIAASVRVALLGQLPEGLLDSGQDILRT